jgi:probable phosphoglycerate mutase
MGFDLCFSSPLKRALETAEILLEGTGIPIITDDRLKEMCFGVAEGCEHIFDHPEYPIYKLFKDPEHYEAVEGGETFEELFARTGSFIREKVLPQVRQGKKVLIVGHGAMNCSIIAQAHHIPLADYWTIGIPNCGLKEVKWEA